MSSQSETKSSPESPRPSSSAKRSTSTSSTDLSSSNEDIQLRGDLIKHDGKYIKRKSITLKGFCEHEDCDCPSRNCGQSQSTPQLVPPGLPGSGTYFYYVPNSELFYGITDGEVVPEGMFYVDENVHVFGTRKQLRAAGLQPNYTAHTSALGRACDTAAVMGSFVKGRGYRFDERIGVTVWEHPPITSLTITVNLEEMTKEKYAVKEKIEEKQNASVARPDLEDGKSEDGRQPYTGKGRRALFEVDSVTT